MVVASSSRASLCSRPIPRNRCCTRRRTVVAASTRRDLLFASAGAGVLLLPTQQASAAGVLELRRDELKAALAEDNEANTGYLEGEIKRIESNAEYLGRTRPMVADGKGNFLQHAVLEVKDLDKAVTFWTQGLGMKVNRARGSGRGRQAFVSYGPETLTADNGGKFALELVENPNSTQDNSGQFFQIALPNSLRVNRLYNSGGDITYGYGYFEIDAPDGYKVVVYIDNRRDPFDLVGVYVDDVSAAATYYEKSFGMKVDRKYGDVEVGRFEPKRTKGSVLVSFNDPQDNTSILLVPRKKPAPATVKIAVLDKDVYERERMLASVGVTPKFIGEVPGTGGTKVALVAPTKGVPLVFVDYNDFEREQPEPAVLTVKEEIQEYVKMAKDDENAVEAMA